jgi:prepilin-type N-terminal cleavage/methylation domain-containing protein
MKDVSPLHAKRKFGSSWGFTLIEVLAVTTIIGTLASLATIAGKSFVEKAQIARAHGDVDKITKAIFLLEVDTGLWPGHQIPGTHSGAGNEVWDLGACSAGLLCNDGGYPNWRGPYLNSIPQDPWKQNYFLDTDYQVAGKDRVVVGSFGPNQVGPNLYDSDDVIKIVR